MKTIFYVSHNGRFLFRTHSEDNTQRAKAVQKELAARFPAADGFRITRDECPGEFISHEVDNGGSR